MFRSVTVRLAVFVIALGFAPCAAIPAAQAQNQIGGHFGAVFPLVTRVNGQTIDISDDFKVGFPMGITVKKTGKIAFDLELVPVLDPDEDHAINVPLTIHPGVLRDLGGNWTGGLRMAFDINGASWGFTPLLNRHFDIPNHSYVYFVEFVLPIRFQDDVFGDTHTAVTFGIHAGIGF